MIPKDIKEAIGDILDVIEQLAESRNALVKLFHQYTHPFSFINKYLRDFPTSSRQVGGMIYRAAKYFADQGAILAMGLYNTPLDPRLAGKIPSPVDNPRLDYSFRYNIQFEIRQDPNVPMHTFNFWVNSTGLLSERDVADVASKALMGLLDRYRLTLSEGFPNSVTIQSTQIQDFVQYIPGLNNG